MENKKNKIENQEYSSLFVPSKQIGFVTGKKSPVFLNFKKRKTLVTVAETFFQIVDLETLSILFSSPFLKEKINYFGCTKERTLLSTETKLFLFERATLIKTFNFEKKHNIIGIFCIKNVFHLFSTNGMHRMISNNLELEEYNLNEQFKKLCLWNPNEMKEDLLLIKEDGSCLVYDLKQKTIKERTSVGSFPTAITEPQRGNVLLLGFQNGRIDIFDLKTKKILFSLKQTDEVTSISFSEEKENVLFSSDINGTIYCWDLEKRTIFFILKKTHQGKITALFSVGKNKILTAGEDNCLKVWSIQEKKIVLFKTKKSHRLTPTKIQFYGDNKSSILSTDGESVFLFSLFKDLQNIELSNKKEEDLGKIVGIDASQEKHHCYNNVLTAHEMDNTAKTWSIDKKGISKDLFTSKDKDIISAVAISPCGNYIATGSFSGMITVFLIQSGRVECFYKPHTNQINSLCFTDLKKIVSGDSSGLLLVSYFKKKESVLIHNFDKSIVKINKARDNLFFAIATERTLSILDSKKDCLVRKFSSEEKIIDCVFSNNKKLLFSSNEKSRIDIWDTILGTYIQSIQTDSIVLSLSFSPCGFFLAAAIKDTGITVFSYQTPYKPHFPSLETGFLDKQKNKTGFLSFSENKNRWKMLMGIDNKEETFFLDRNEDSSFLTERIKEGKQVQKQETVNCFEDLKKMGNQKLILYLSEIEKEDSFQILRVIQKQLEEEKDFDLCVSYLSLFLKKKKELVSENNICFKKILKEIRENIDRQWNTFRQDSHTIRCVLSLIR